MKFCTNCTKRQFNPQKGLVCSLTEEHADFDIECEHFIENTEMLRDQKLRKELRDAQSKSSDLFGLAKYGIKSELLGGIIFLVAGLAWLIGGWVNGIIFFYPFYMILLGVVLTIVGIVKKTKRPERSKQERILRNLLLMIYNDLVVFIQV